MTARKNLPWTALIALIGSTSCASDGRKGPDVVILRRAEPEEVAVVHPVEDGQAGGSHVYGGATDAGEARPEALYTAYVQERTQVRREPSWSASVTNVLYREQTVEVLEERDGWAQVSMFHGAGGERWVPRSALLKDPITARPLAPIAHHERVMGIPRVGQGGLTERDVEILHAAARYYLETGQAKMIEYGDKSIHKLGTYYLNFGGDTNHFFRPDSIPNLERRIRMLRE